MLMWDQRPCFQYGINKLIMRGALGYVIDVGWRLRYICRVEALMLMQDGGNDNMWTRNLGIMWVRGIKNLILSIGVFWSLCMVEGFTL